MHQCRNSLQSWLYLWVSIPTSICTWSRSRWGGAVITRRLLWDQVHIEVGIDTQRWREFRHSCSGDRVQVDLMNEYMLPDANSVWTLASSSSYLKPQQLLQWKNRRKSNTSACKVHLENMHFCTAFESVIMPTHTTLELCKCNMCRSRTPCKSRKCMFGRLCLWLPILNSASANINAAK